MAASAKDCRIAVGFASHPKIVKLRRRLGADGVLSLIALWAWTAGNKPSGDLAGISDEDLEICAGWPGAAGGLIRELTDLRLLDGEAGARTIHDWGDHNGWAAGADRRSEAARQAALAKHRGSSAGRNEYPAVRTAEAEIVPADSSAPHAEPAKTSCPVSVSVSVSDSVSDSITGIPDPKKPKRTRSAEQTFAEFIATCEEKKIDAIPKNDPVFRYATKIGLPNSFLELAWYQFESRYTSPNSRHKKYRNWPQTFFNAVEGNWFRLWYRGDDNEWRLTTAGQQAELAQRSSTQVDRQATSGNERQDPQGAQTMSLQQLRTLV